MQIEEKTRTEPKGGLVRKKDLSERIIEFVVSAIKSVSTFPITSATKHIGNQLIRSASSVGANYEEACTAQSRADFIHKMQIALKEIRETVYWMKLATKLELTDNDAWPRVINEANQLLLILAKSVATTKGVAK